MELKRKRKKTWDQKVKIVKDGFLRASKADTFAANFYRNLFFLNPDIEAYFENTDFEHQERALMNGLKYLFGFYDSKDANAKNQIKRIAISHSRENLNIVPHYYYYWVEALIMTAKDFDDDWVDKEEIYWREVLHFPISFIVSMYLHEDE